MARHFRTAILVSLATLPLLATGACGHKGGRPRNPDLAASKITQIGVNSYLWRASLETLSFMPRQTNQGGQWVAAPVQAATVQKLEDIILTKARDLRRQAVAG